ncbi:TPA: hypothetical protein QHR58_004510 [Enterobacter kobei]|nr:hypothetical protein [Enterobacter kobei]
MPAFSSSNDSWNDLFLEANSACLKASNMINTKISNPIIFSDDTGIISYLIKGELKQSQKKIQMLCIYDKNKKAAEANEYIW